MATNIDQLTIENNGTTFVNGKNADVPKSEKKKHAFGDLKNALIDTPSQSAPKKKVEIQKENTPDDEYVGIEYASSKDVDFFDAWVEKLTFTDEQVDQWMRNMIKASEMNPYDERELPPPSPAWTEIPIEIPEVEDDMANLIPPEIMEDIDDMEPMSPTSEYHSFSADSSEEEQPSNNYNDSELSALNQSVFELSLPDDSDDDERS